MSRQTPNFLGSLLHTYYGGCGLIIAQEDFDPWEDNVIRDVCVFVVWSTGSLERLGVNIEKYDLGKSQINEMMVHDANVFSG